MRSYEANHIAGQFLNAFAGGLKGMNLTDMVMVWMEANDIEMPPEPNPTGEERDDAAEAESQVVAAVKQAIADAGRRTMYRAQQDAAERYSNEQRVLAIIEQFNLVSGETGYENPVDAKAMTDALYGAAL